MPSQQGFGLHDRYDLSQNSSAQLLGLGCETAMLVIIQAESSAAKLFSKNLVLLMNFEAVTDRILVACYSALVATLLRRNTTAIRAKRVAATKSILVCCADSTRR